MGFAERAHDAFILLHRDLREVVLGHAPDGLLDGVRHFDADQIGNALVFHQVTRGRAFDRLIAHGAHPLGVEHLGEITRAVVVEDHHHRLPGFEPVLQLEKAGDGRPRGVPREDALLPDDLAGVDSGVAVGHLLEMINDREVHVFGKEVLADAFRDIRIDLVLVEDALFLVLLEDGTVRVNAPALHLWLLLFEVFARAADRAAGAHADHEVVDLSFGLFPDLRAGRFVVGLRVREVVVLVGLPAVRGFSHQTGGN